MKHNNIVFRVLTGQKIRIIAEFYSFRPAGNERLYTQRLYGFPLVDEELSETIKRAKELIPSGYNPYKMRLRYEYERKGKRNKVVHTSFFFVAGSIKPKKEVAEYFGSINPEVGERIAAFSGDNVFWVHYEVQAVDQKHNYDLLPYFEPKKAKAA